MKSIIPGGDDDRCYICKKGGALERHHCLHGSRRQLADKYGLTVNLCPACHKALHDHGLFDHELEKIAQKNFETWYGHEEYMKVFGKNYL